MGVVRDDPASLEAALQQAAAAADVVLTSGGVSVGEADYIKGILTKLGHINFWKIAIKPGRPLAFGTLGKALFFGLPGNPVAVMVTFLHPTRVVETGGGNGKRAVIAGCSVFKPPEKAARSH